MRKYLIYSVSLAFAFVVMIFAGMAIPHPSSWFGGSNGGCTTNRVFLISNGVHTDIAFSQSDLAKHDLYSRIFPDPKSVTEDALIGFGWGEKIFYTEVKEWEDLTFSKAMQATFNSPGSLMHVSIYPSRAADANTKLCEKAWLQLVDSISSSFVVPEDGTLLPQPGYGDFDWFFEATGTYSPFYTCNSWTVSHLRRVGISTPMLGQFADPVVWHFPDDGGEP